MMAYGRPQVPTPKTISDGLFNPLSEEAIINIVQRLADNNTLELLWLPDCHQDVKDNISLKDDVNKKRKTQGCHVKLEVKFV